MILLDLGGKIKGDSKVDKHDDWITCESFQFGVGRSVSMSGGGADRDTSTPSFSEVTLTKSTDKASTDLFLQATHGKSLGKAKIHFIQTGDKTQPYLIYELDETIVSSYSLSSAGDRPSESISLNFTKVWTQYDHFDGSTIHAGQKKGYDLMVNQQL